MTVQMVWAPGPGDPTDDDLKREAAESTDPEGAYSELDEEYFECYALDPRLAYRMFWAKVHFADRLGLETDDEAKARRLSMGVGAEVEATGTLGRWNGELILRLQDGGIWRLSDRAVPYDVFSTNMTVRGLRTGYDVISDWQFAD